MSQILFFVSGAIVGGIAVWFAVRMPERKKKESLIEKQAREKAADMESILGLLKTQEKLTNSHIEMMLGIPESTVTRYMDELEKEGKVRQVGDTGAGVYYEEV